MVCRVSRTSKRGEHLPALTLTSVGITARVAEQILPIGGLVVVPSPFASCVVVAVQDELQVVFIVHRIVLGFLHCSRWLGCHGTSRHGDSN